MIVKGVPKCRYKKVSEIIIIAPTAMFHRYGIWSCVNIKTVFVSYGDSNYTDKTIVRQSNLYNRNSYFDDIFILIRTPLSNRGRNVHTCVVRFSRFVTVAFLSLINQKRNKLKSFCQSTDESNFEILNGVIRNAADGCKIQIVMPVRALVSS